MAGPVSFTDLIDVPGSYVGQAGKYVRVNATEDGLEFFTLPLPSVQVSTYQHDVPASAQIMMRYLTVEAWSLPANMAGSRADIATAATAAATINIQKNAVTVGTISIAGTVPTFATVGGTAVAFVPGDTLDILAPVAIDATLARIAITLTGLKT